jgi:hypothetical protein
MIGVRMKYLIIALLLLGNNFAFSEEIDKYLACYKKVIATVTYSSDTKDICQSNATDEEIDKYLACYEKVIATVTYSSDTKDICQSNATDEEIDKYLACYEKVIATVTYSSDTKDICKDETGVKFTFWDYIF